MARVGGSQLHAPDRALLRESARWPAHTLTERDACSVECLLDGSFSPLGGFMCERDYCSVLADLRLAPAADGSAEGAFWPVPITLAVGADLAAQLRGGADGGAAGPEASDAGKPSGTAMRLTLCDDQNNPIALCTVEDVFEPDVDAECRALFGTVDRADSRVDHLVSLLRGCAYVGGPLVGIQTFKHFDFPALRRSPEETRAMFAARGWTRVVAFHTASVMHATQYHATLAALREAGDGARLLIHAAAGSMRPRMPGELGYQVRVRCLQSILGEYPAGHVALSLVPLNAEMQGPRLAVWRAVVARNYGCTHFLFSTDEYGEDAFAPLEVHAARIGVSVVRVPHLLCVPETGAWVAADRAPPGARDLTFTQPQVSQMLRSNETLPEGFTFPTVLDELRQWFKQPFEEGLCVYFVGLSASGKSTVAAALRSKLLEMEVQRKITTLDGDIVRHNLTKGLGFSKADRSINVRRIGYVCSEIVRHGGVVLVANIAPYVEDRQANRELISRHGNYVQVFVNTPLAVCEERDPKGLYALARQGKIKEFTGISDPFEAPTESEVEVDCTDPVEDCLQSVLSYLTEHRLLPPRVA